PARPPPRVCPRGSTSERVPRRESRRRRRRAAPACAPAPRRPRPPLRRRSTPPPRPPPRAPAPPRAAGRRRRPPPARRARARARSPCSPPRSARCAWERKHMGPLRLVEEALLDQPRALLGGDLDVARREKEDLVGDALHPAVERVREPGGEVDQAVPEVGVGALQVEHDRD